MNYYSGKLALITGGSSGIGLALAKGIVDRGGDVAILARHEDGLSNAKNELEGIKKDQTQKVFAVKADITDAEELNVILTKFKSEVGLPDLVINSAGVAHPGKFSSLNPDIFHWMMDVNYFGTVNVLKNFVGDFQQRHSGAICNISSIAGFIGVYGYSAYGASKYAVSGLTDVLRSELKPYGVQVSIVFPPDTQTPQLEYESQFKPFITKEVAGSANLMSADAVAKEVLEKLARGTYVILPGGEGKLLYTAKNLFGRTLYPVMDWMVRSAISKIQFGK
ncbi:MAG: SDR family oxidoreductase [Anaerolineaceae bacterium]|nr:SDR family oxidoreductase [Anaerolineaceae bacterium]